MLFVILQNLDSENYQVIMKFKKQKRLPEKESIKVIDIGVKVSLQSLLNHTAVRFIKLLRSDLEPSTKKEGQ